MENLDLVYDVVKHNQEGIDKILAILPSFQTQEKCEEIRKNKKKSKFGWIKYIITTLIALIALLISLSVVFI